MPPLLRYDIKTVSADGSPHKNIELPAAYQATDPATLKEFKNAVEYPFFHHVLMDSGYATRNLPAESPVVELWNGGECAVRIRLDMPYMHKMMDEGIPCVPELHYSHGGDRQRGLYFDVFIDSNLKNSGFPANPCEAEYMEMFDAALLEYERRTEPDEPVEVNWRPALHYFGFHRPITLPDMQDFRKQQGELYEWHSAPGRFDWEYSPVLPYGAGLADAAKAGTVAAVMRHGEYFMRLSGWPVGKVSPSPPLEQQKIAVRARGRLNFQMDFACEETPLVSVFAAVLGEGRPDHEKRPDYSKIGAIVEILDRALVRFESNKAAGRKTYCRKIFV